jgi:hypothetical protein
MLKRDGYLNLCEAADYLGVPVGFLWAHYEQRFEPFFYCGPNKATMDSGPWYEAKDLDAYRPRAADAVKRWRREQRLVPVSRAGHPVIADAGRPGRR